MSDLVRFCDMMNENEFGTFELFCWEFLCRVQSEAVPLEAGRSTDEVMLPEGRHSGVYIEGNDICVRWMRRKNRPRGSFLRRGCTCTISGSHGHLDKCLVHRMTEKLHGMQQGSRVFHWSGPQAVAKLRRYLRLFKIPHG